MLEFGWFNFVADGNFNCVLYSVILSNMFLICRNLYLLLLISHHIIHNLQYKFPALEFCLFCNNSQTTAETMKWIRPMNQNKAIQIMAKCDVRWAELLQARDVLAISKTILSAKHITYNRKISLYDRFGQRKKRLVNEVFVKIIENQTLKQMKHQNFYQSFFSAQTKWKHCVSVYRVRMFVSVLFFFLFHPFIYEIVRNELGLF